MGHQGDQRNCGSSAKSVIAPGENKTKAHTWLMDVQVVLCQWDFVFIVILYEE
jgi:hypothetical protein